MLALLSPLSPASISLVRKLLLRVWWKWMRGVDPAGSNNTAATICLHRSNTIHNCPAQWPWLDPGKSVSVTATLATRLEGGPRTLSNPPQWSVWGSDNVPSPGPSTAGMGLAPLSPRSGAAPLIGLAGSPSHSWPTDKAHVFPTDCPRRQLEGWEPEFLGDMARREQWVMRTGGLLQGVKHWASLGPFSGQVKVPWLP